MIKINLLPPEYAEAQSKLEQRILFGGAGGLLLFILLIVWGTKKAKLSGLIKDVTEAESELKKYRAIEAEINRIESSKKVLSAKREVIKNLNKSRLVYPVFLEDFLPIIPPEVWIRNLNTTTKGNSMKLDMDSNALSNYSLATWLTNLQQSEHFSGVSLGPINYSPGKSGPPVLSFRISCNYQHKGPFPLAGMN